MMNHSAEAPRTVRIEGPEVDGSSEILTLAALEFVADLTRRFAPRIETALAERGRRRIRLAHGEPLDFLSETAAIRAAEWTVAPLPPDLLERTVEITGPVDRKMVINALNSGANVFMADFEDATAPTWDNLVHGQINLAAAVRRRLTHVDGASGKSYRLNERIATLMVRPRGLHLPEHHLRVDDAAIPGCLMDFGLFIHHNGAELVARGSGPYFYLPKMESARELAREAAPL